MTLFMFTGGDMVMALLSGAAIGWITGFLTGWGRGR